MPQLPGVGFNMTASHISCGKADASVRWPQTLHGGECYPLAQLPGGPKSLTVRELQDEKQAARAGRLTLWPSALSRRATGVHAERGRRIIPASIPRGLLKKGLALFVVGFF